MTAGKLFQMAVAECLKAQHDIKNKNDINNL